jgi:L,D-transpeptidase catalytic domain
MLRAAIALLALGACASEDNLGESEHAIDLDAFTLPQLSAEQRAPIVRRYDRLDPTNAIPRGLLEDAIVYLDANLSVIPKTRHFIVVDLSLYSGKDRFWLVDLVSGAVESHKTAHGDGSDPDNNGYATAFGNIDGSHMSSLGFYLTGEIYDGTHPHSMRLDGLTRAGSPNNMVNTAARTRLIVVHEASYVNDASTTQQGRSNGCPALDPDINASVVDRVFGGSLMYIATTPLATPVGRATCGDALCDGSETLETCPLDCSDPEPPADDPGIDPAADGGGCSTGGGAGLIFAFALVGLRRQRVHS